MKEKEERLNAWRVRFENSRKVEKRKNGMKLLVITFFVITSIFVSYYWWLDELKFLGRETSFVKAVVTDEKMIHWGRGYYYQTGNCDYYVQEKQYHTSFRINEFYLLVRVGDTINLKIATHKPEIAKIE